MVYHINMSTWAQIAKHEEPDVSAKKNKTYELHKWEGEERKKFFRTLILCYLDCEKAKASNGVDSG